MSVEENKALVRRFVEEVLNQHNPEAMDELMVPDIRTSSRRLLTGREGFKQDMRAFLSAFPDVHVTVEDMLGEGDRVVTRARWTATHRGEFLGVPPTGKQVEGSYIDFWHVQNGRLVANWAELNFLGVLQQLGPIPAAEQAST